MVHFLLLNSHCNFCASIKICILLKRSPVEGYKFQYSLYATTSTVVKIFIQVTVIDHQPKGVRRNLG